MSNTNNLWEDDEYCYDVGSNYIIHCGDSDLAIDDTLDSHRMHWCEHLVTGAGYVRWTPHKLNQLARLYIQSQTQRTHLDAKGRELIDQVTEAFWGCTMKEAITLVGKGEAHGT